MAGAPHGHVVFWNTLLVMGLLVYGPCVAVAQIDYAAIRAERRVAALRTTQSVLIDGRLDEPSWEFASPATDFYQQQPDDGALTTERSEVRFLYDLHAIYVGGTFFESDPRGGITNELRRDFSARDGDLITVVLDTFHDGRNAFGFMINPAGAQRDSQAYDDGRQNNQNWDGVWWIQTARFDKGWTMEMKIPFKTLRFAGAEEQVWGLQIMRLIRRKNEITMWSPVPRQFTQFKVSYAGVLTGIRGIDPGRNLRVKPFITASASNLPIGDVDRTWEADGGVDVKYGLGTALALDATYRTDFSQVEADDQQINLTRFSLFFPEKREFFLENQGAFRIGDQDSGGQGGGRGSASLAATRRDLLPFFSRRIGLSDAGEQIPVVGGARLTGKQGPYTLGLLNMQTERFGVDPWDNYTAARVARDIGEASAASAFYLGRESVGERGFNRVGGGEIHLNFRRTIDVNGFVMGSAAPNGINGMAGRASVAVEENRYTALAAYTNISPGFRNDLGFIPRGNIGLFNWDAAPNVRPQKTYRWVREYAAGTSGETFENSGHDRLLSRRVGLYGSADLASGGGARTDFSWNYERLTEPFEVSRGVTLPAGEYRFRQFVPAITTDKSRAVSGTFRYTAGDFYSGTVRGFEGGARLRINMNLAVSADVARNNVHLPQGHFVTDVRRFRIDYSFSTRMFLNALIQYNSAARTWSTNVRYRFIYRPLSDLFLVYNDTRTEGSQGHRTLSLKHTILLAF